MIQETSEIIQIHYVLISIAHLVSFMPELLNELISPEQ